MFTDLARLDDSRSRSGVPCVAGAVGIVPGSRAFAAAMAIVHETMGASSVMRRRLSARTTHSKVLTPVCSPQAG